MAVRDCGSHNEIPQCVHRLFIRHGDDVYSKEIFQEHEADAEHPENPGQALIRYRLVYGEMLLDREILPQVVYNILKKDPLVQGEIYRGRDKENDGRQSREIPGVQLKNKLKNIDMRPIKVYRYIKFC